MKKPALKELLAEVERCGVCRSQLPHPPRPVIRAGVTARILIIGQAPGTRVHRTGIPWNDPSGDLLRQWMAVDRDVFYDESRIALMPMGFCYPGKGASGDLPPRQECAPMWHQRLISHMPDIRLTLLVGRYAHQYYLGPASGPTLRDTVREYQKFLPGFMPLVHPSPRNRNWLKNNPWFEIELVPVLRRLVGTALE